MFTSARLNARRAEGRAAARFSRDVRRSPRWPPGFGGAGFLLLLAIIACVGCGVENAERGTSDLREAPVFYKMTLS